MNELENKALNFIRKNEFKKLKTLPKEKLNFRNNMLVYRAIADSKYSCFRYLISIKEVRDIYAIKHAFLLTIHNKNDKILKAIIKMSNDNPIVLNKKDNTYLLEKLIKSEENKINENIQLYSKYIDFDNLLFSKKIFFYAFFNKNLYYLDLMYEIDKEQFFENLNSTSILQKAINDIERKDFSFNNIVFRFNNSFYKQIINHVKKGYRQDFIEEIKRNINANLIQLNMEGF